MSRDAASTILRMLPRLPNIASTVGFEIRLSGDDPRVDLGVSLQRSPLVLEAWRRFASGAGENGADLAAWGGAEAFLEAWCADDSPLDPWIPFIFLEIDADSGTFTPCIFTSFDWPLGVRDDDAERRRSWHVAETALDLLLHERLQEPVRAKLREAFEHLPPSGRVVHAGAMLGRRTDQVRLSIAVPKWHWEDYLDSLGLEAERYRHGIQAIDPIVDTVHFECDFSGKPGERIGIVLGAHGLANERTIPIGGLFSDTRDRLVRLLAWLNDSTRAAPGLSLAISHLKLDLCADCSGLKAYVSVGAARPLGSNQPPPLAT